jgi:hypothetical protein
MKLFVIYIGGKTTTSLIELHDMCFVVSDSIENTYETLRKKWWGTSNSLHLDAWGILNYADGYNIVLKDYPANFEQKLYFVNLGGYDKNKFTELHKNIFIVAENESKAKIKALKQVLDWQSYHRDNQYEIENCISVDEQIEKNKLYIHLEKSENFLPFEFTCKYVAIGK